MKVKTRWINDLKVEVEVENEEKILRTLKALGVADPELYLRAWVDFITGDATVFQVEVIESNERALRFLESITTTEE